MTMFLTITAIILIFLVIFQISKANEYIAIIKGEEKARKQGNNINAYLMLGFMIVGLFGVWYCNKLLYNKTLLGVPAASDHGEKVDQMLWVTLWITGIVFIITQILLFWFAFKYREQEGKKVFFFPHSTKLEIIWTSVPAIVLAVLIVIGLKNWYIMTGDAPKNALEVEVVGKQFNWIYRYKGADDVFGKKYYKVINEANNPLGLIWQDNEKLGLKDDIKAHDDIVLQQTMYVIKGKPVKLIIGSRDVIHDVGLPHFRLKMDAVPGIPTTLWFTPKYTTKEMKEITKNPDFIYEISCDQMCGNGHYSMKGIIEVVTQKEFDELMAGKTPAYHAAFPNNNPKTETAAPATAAVVDNKPIAQKN